jgi:hypothetical protein
LHPCEIYAYLLRTHGAESADPWRVGSVSS